MTSKATFVGFDLLKRAVSMVQVLDRYGLVDRLHRSGDNLSGACPIHAGHNQTQFRVSLSKNCWICFGDCNGGGSIIDFVSRKEGVGIRDAALLIQDWFGVEPPNGDAPIHNCQARTKPETPNVDVLVNPPLGFAVQDLDPTHVYLTARGLTKETIQTFGLGYCRTGTLTGRIAIPIHNTAGKLVAYASRWPGEPADGVPKYKLPKGFKKSLELFNLHRARRERPGEPLVVVEGFFGCMRVWQAGYRRVVSTMGSMVSRAQEQHIIQTVSEDGEVILAFDEDEAGRKGGRDALDRLARQVKVHLVRFAKEGAQPDHFEPNDLMQLLTSARS